MTKALLRSKYKVLRNQLSSEKIEDLSLEIANKILELPIWEFNYYHIFLPISEMKEVNTEYLLHILQGKDKSIVIPKTNFDKGEMSHILLQENTKLALSKYNIPEPISGIEISIPQIEVVFVPLLAYDEVGRRIGYGKGFYDRFLAKCDPKTIFIGLSLFPPEKKIPQEIQDVPLHFCITPEKIYSF
jgi:5-formyltetrahydrofolate cyclo-ligase